MKEELRGKRNRAFSFDEKKAKTTPSEPVEQKPVEKPKPEEPKPKPKPQDDDDSTDKYIALLQKGIIGKEEFVALMGLDRDRNHTVAYQ